MGNQSSTGEVSFDTEKANSDCEIQVRASDLPDDITQRELDVAMAAELSLDSAEATTTRRKSGGAADIIRRATASVLRRRVVESARHSSESDYTDGPPMCIWYDSAGWTGTALRHSSILNIVATDEVSWISHDHRMKQDRMKQEGKPSIWQFGQIWEGIMARAIVEDKLLWWTLVRVCKRWHTEMSCVHSDRGARLRQVWQMAHNFCFDYMLTVQVVGDHGTGKSSLIRRFIQRRFDNSAPFQNRCISKNVVVRGNLIKLVLWETDKSVEEDKSRMRDFLQEEQVLRQESGCKKECSLRGIMMVYDATDLESFAHMGQRVERVFKKRQQGRVERPRSACDGGCRHEGR